MGNGSGVLFNSLGFVLTNQHVVDGASSVSVVIGNAGHQVEYEAGVVGVDADIDLALLKITDVAFGGVAAPPFSFQTKASVGEEIFALGYPMALSGLGAEMKYTNGSVSANSGFNGDMKTMQISVPIQGGNSGGPLFNAQGELIGITNAKIRSDIADNVSYAIKSIFVEAFLGSMPYQVSLPNGSVETESRVDVIDALRPYTCLVLVK
jgi:S1-C subfamily serine protease